MKTNNVDEKIEKALNHSRKFMITQKVYETREEDKSLIGNVIQIFSKRTKSMFIEKHGEELNTEDEEKLLEIERIKNLEQLYKILQQSIEKIIDDQSEVNRWFYNLQLFFCENYIALANLLPVVIVYF